jgi:ribosomal protein S6
MFLFDPTFGNSFEKCESEIRRLMERAQAEVLYCRKWDERRLAFRIKGRKRGVYVLVHFKAPPDRIVPLERDAKLAEHILRVLVTRAEGVTPEQMERQFATRGPEQERRASPAKEAAKPETAKPEETEPEATSEVSDAGPGGVQEPEPAKTGAAVVDRPEGEPVETE